MLRYTVRRVLWAIPTLLVTSLVLFLVTTLAPDPQASPAGADDPLVAEARRDRLLDLPRFFNAAPEDVRTRAARAVARVAAGDDRRGRAARRLARLGGAALPYVLPALETLPPEARARVAMALVPVAVRMGLAGAEDLGTPEAAALFWTRFWDDRALDFTSGAVDRAVDRLVEHGTGLRERDLVALDTFALRAVVRAIGASPDGAALERLTRIARHATGRGPVVAADASPAEARRAAADWREWWFVHRTDFVPLDGMDRIASMVIETRYGKWLERAVRGELGVSVVDGEPILDKLRSRAPLTLLVCLAAMLASWAVAVPVGAVAAWRRGRAFDVTSAALLFVSYATPTFAIAELLRRAALSVSPGGLPAGMRVPLAVAALAVGSVATLSRWQRAAMLEVVGQDYVRTARAKGLPAWRVAADHALRNALLPIVTIAGLHLPVLLGGAFVVEEVFGVPGVGYETLRAIEAHDTAWLMAVVLACAVAVTVGLVASDVAYGALDPRVRQVLSRREGGAAP